MRHWRKTLKNLWIDTRCGECKENLERIERHKLKPTEIIVIRPDILNKFEQHILILDKENERHREMKVGELV